VIVTFPETVTVHVMPEVDVHPIHALKLLLPAVAGAMKDIVAPELSVSVAAVVPVVSAVVP
jgi:hypothetical protein